LALIDRSQRFFSKRPTRLPEDVVTGVMWIMALSRVVALRRGELSNAFGDRCDYP